MGCVVAITGPRASGKSHALVEFARLGARFLSTDHLSYTLLQEHKEEIRAIYGDDIFDADGNIDKEKIIDDLAKVRASFRLCHPLLIERLNSEIKIFRDAGSEDVLFIEFPVWLANRMSDLCDKVLYIDAPREILASRVRERTGCTKEESDLCVDSESDYRFDIDHTIVNDSSLDDLSHKVKSYYDVLTIKQGVGQC